jgi:hypothetical protein
MVSLSFIQSPAEIQLTLAAHFVQARLAVNETQATASIRTGVPLSTLRKFERTGIISLTQFLLICHVYGDLSQCDQLFPIKASLTMDQLIASKKASRKRARS